MSNRLLDSMSSGERLSLGQDLELVDLPKGPLATADRSSSPYCFFPLDGVVSCAAAPQSGQPFSIGLVGREGMVGLACLYADNTAHSSLFEVVVRGTAIRVDADRLRGILQTEPGIAKRLDAYTREWLDQIAADVLAGFRCSSDQRLAHLLYVLSSKAALQDIDITPAEIAALLGIPRQSISTDLATLAALGCIVHDAKQVSIVDRPVLAQAANGFRQTGWGGEASFCTLDDNPSKGHR